MIRHDLPADGEPKGHKALFASHAVASKKGKKTLFELPLQSGCQVKLVIRLAGSGLSGLVRIPHEDAECQRVSGQYQDFVARRSQRLWELIEQRTADEEMQLKIYEVLASMLLRKS